MLCSIIFDDGMRDLIYYIKRKGCFSLFLCWTGGIQLPFNSSLYGRSPLPGTVYYNQFTCPNNSISFDECDPKYGGDQCYTGELEYVVQCTSKCK